MVIWTRFAFCFCVCFTTRAVARAPPQFRPDGTFTIVQVTDVHLNPQSINQTIDIINAVLDAEKPDFVAYTGDICSRSCNDEPEQSAIFHAAFDPSDKRGIPWAVTYGNWDRKPDAFWTGLQDTEFIMNNFSHSLNKAAPANVDGDSVFDIPIMFQGVPAAVLYFMDTHANDGCEGVSGTGCIYPSEVAWYNATSAAYRKKNEDHPVPGVAFFHIPLPEHIAAWNTGSATYGRLDEGAGDRGLGVSCVIKSSGFFDAAVANGDIKAMTCGHDHDNDFHAVYKGINLMYGRKTGFGSYGPPASWGSFPQKDGARVIKLTRDASSGEIAIETWVRLMDGTIMSTEQEGQHVPGTRPQTHCNSIALEDAIRHGVHLEKFEV